MRPAGELAARLANVIGDERVLAALASIPRERFVPAAEQARAYENVALPIAGGQSISQPLVVARMLELLALTGAERVLDLGTGSGYHAALLSLLAGEVWTIERLQDLSVGAQAVLGGLGIDNVRFLVGDGSRGLPEQAPFDVINVAAAVGRKIPQALEAQLGPGGRLVAPVGEEQQHLILVRRTARGLRRRMLEPVRFVPLVPEPGPAEPA